MAKKTKASFITNTKFGRGGTGIALQIYKINKRKTKKTRNIAKNMTETQIKYYLSGPRFNIYLRHADNQFEEAYHLYQLNIEISGAFYPLLSIIEICLRNSINENLKKHFNDPFWFKNHLPIEFGPFIREAERKILNRHPNFTADKIIAELSFGFWSRLFNSHYSKYLWKPLRLIFNNMPKELRRREVVSDTLYRIRKLRNRVYHYEPIFGDLNNLEQLYYEMILFITWLDKDLPTLLRGIDHFMEILEKGK